MSSWSRSGLNRWVITLAVLLSQFSVSTTFLICGTLQNLLVLLLLQIFFLSFLWRLWWFNKQLSWLLKNPTHPDRQGPSWSGERCGGLTWCYVICKSSRAVFGSQPTVLFIKLVMFSLQFFYASFQSVFEGQVFFPQLKSYVVGKCSSLFSVQSPSPSWE